MQSYFAVRYFMIKKIKSYFTDSAVKNTITLCAAVRFYLALNNIPTIKAVFSNAISIISPFIYAFAIAFILNRPMMWFERTLFKDKKKKRIPVSYTHLDVYKRQATAILQSAGG